MYNTEETKMNANRKYKASLFAELFSEPNRLRELYNALAGTDYGEETIIEINTLESAFFNDLRNDVSFTIGGKYVLLLEHQSTINSNMPLRLLSYIARVFEKITDDRAIYHDKLIEIPTPEFIVLYNGIKPFPAEKTLKLSDAYKGTDKTIEKFGSLELTVRVVNINPGYNDDLLQKSEALNGYTAFIEYVRNRQETGLNLNDALKEAVNWGIAQDVLRAVLIKYGVEVSGMIPGTTFDIDIAKEVWREEALEEGYEKGREEGREEGYEKGREEARKEFKAEIEELHRQIAELQNKND